MLSRIVKITGLGLLHDVHPPELAFTRVTLIHAENARGKSTLSSLFRSVQTGDVTELLERRTIGTTADLYARLKFDTSVDVVLENGAWSSVRDDVVVFDADFVDKNVYSGIAVTTGHRKNLLDFALGTSAVEAREKSAIADAAYATAKADHDALADKFSVNLEELTFTQFKALAEPDDFDTLKAELSQRRTNAAEANVIAVTPGPVSIPALAFDLDSTLQALSSTIEDAHNDAQTLVQEHVAAMHRRAAAVGDPSAWLAEGRDYDDGETCPYCEQPTVGVDLVRAYRVIFNEAFAALRTAVEASSRHVAQSLAADAGAKVSTQVDLANALLDSWRKRCPITLLELDEEAITESIAAVRRDLEIQFEAKLLDIAYYAISDEDHDGLKARWTAITESIDAINVAQARNADAVAGLKATLAAESLEELDRRLADLERASRRHSSQLVEQITTIDAARTTMNTRKREKDKARLGLSAVMDSTLGAYRVSTNKYLRLLGAQFSIHTMTGNHRAGGRSDFAIDMRGSQVRAEGGTPTFSTALSEGDRRTLALAFFLASTLGQANVGRLLAVIDDPVSSFDAARTKATTTLLKELGGKASQVIVLSHDAHFLRQLHKRLGTTDAVAMLGIVHAPGQYSTIERIDIEAICESKYNRHYRIVRGMVDGSFGDAPTAAQSIRPLLEGYLSRRYPHLLAPSGSLNDYILAIESAESTSPLVRLTGLVSELREVGAYANPNHHDEGPSEDDQPVNTTEVGHYCGRALAIVYA